MRCGYLETFVSSKQNLLVRCASSSALRRPAGVWLVECTLLQCASMLYFITPTQFFFTFAVDIKVLWFKCSGFADICSHAGQMIGTFFDGVFSALLDIAAAVSLTWHKSRGWRLDEPVFIRYAGHIYQLAQGTKGSFKNSAQVLANVRRVPNSFMCISQYNTAVSFSAFMIDQLMSNWRPCCTN